MPADFTVIVRVRHQFGDQEIDRDEANVDHEAPFVGLDGEFQFACPNVDSSAEAVFSSHIADRTRLYFSQTHRVMKTLREFQGNIQ